MESREHLGFDPVLPPPSVGEEEEEENTTPSEKGWFPGTEARDDA